MKVITAVVNNIVFIEIHYHTLQKYLKGVDSYEFIVAKAFSDFTNGDSTIRAKISETYQTLDIQCIPNDHKT